MEEYMSELIEDWANAFVPKVVHCGKYPQYT